MMDPISAAAPAAQTLTPDAAAVGLNKTAGTYSPTTLTPPTADNTPSPTFVGGGGSSTTRPHGAGQRPSSPLANEGSSSDAPTTIVRLAFGPDADLYSDVLHVSSFSTDRDIRTAYFRRGREVLSEPDETEDEDNSGGKGGTATIIGMSVTQRTKLQFQAVSVAYEILSNPRLRAEYDRTGQIPDATTTATATSANNEPPRYAPEEPSSGGSAPAVQLRGESGGAQEEESRQHHHQQQQQQQPAASVLPSRPSRIRSKQGVSWNENVEELVIKDDPCLVNSRRSWDCLDDDDIDTDDRSVSSGSTASSGLRDQIRRLEERTERFARQEFLDSLEASMNGLIDAASRAMAEKATTTTKGAVQQQPRREEVGTMEKEEETNRDAAERGGGDEAEIDRHGKSTVRRKLVFDMKDMSTKGGDGDVGGDVGADPTSPLVGGVLTIEENPSTDGGGGRPVKSDSDTVSTVTEQGGEVTPSQQRITPSSPQVGVVERGQVSAGEGGGVANEEDGPEDERNAETGSNGAGSIEKAQDGTTYPNGSRNGDQASTNDDLAANFYIHLSSYIKGAAQEMQETLDRVGKSWNDIEWNNLPASVADSWTIREEELDSMVGILQSEVDRSPLGGTYDVVSSLQGSKNPTGSSVAASP